MKNLLTLAAAALLFSGCNNMSYTEVSLSDLSQNAAQFVDKGVTLTGVVANVCKESGSACELLSPDASSSIQLSSNCEETKLSSDLEGKSLTINGVVKARVINAAYLDQWESEAVAAMQTIDPSFVWVSTSKPASMGAGSCCSSGLGTATAAKPACEDETATVTAVAATTTEASCETTGTSTCCQSGTEISQTEECCENTASATATTVANEEKPGSCCSSGSATATAINYNKESVMAELNQIKALRAQMDENGEVTIYSVEIVEMTTNDRTAMN